MRNSDEFLPEGFGGYVENVDTDEETGEVLVSLRLDPERAGVDFREGEASLDRSLLLPKDREEDLLDALDPRGCSE